MPTPAGDTPALLARAQGGDVEAVEALLARFRPLAAEGVRVSRRVLPRFLDWEAVESAAGVALWRAIVNFRCETGTPFEAYAAGCVRLGVRDEARRQGGLPGFAPGSAVGRSGRA